MAKNENKDLTVNMWAHCFELLTGMGWTVSEYDETDFSIMVVADGATEQIVGDPRGRFGMSHLCKAVREFDGPEFYPTMEEYEVDPTTVFDPSVEDVAGHPSYEEICLPERVVVGNGVDIIIAEEQDDGSWVRVPNGPTTYIVDTSPINPIIEEQHERLVRDARLGSLDALCCLLAFDPTSKSYVAGDGKVIAMSNPVLGLSHTQKSISKRNLPKWVAKGWTGRIETPLYH